MELRKTNFSNLRFLQILIPSAISLLSFLIAHIAGFDRIHIPLNAWQLLDKELLLTKPIQSLTLLHVQPPGLNATLAAILRISSFLGINPEAITYILFVILGTIASVYLYKTIIKFTNAHVFAALPVLIFTFNPASWVYGHRFFYPYILACLFIFLAYQIQKVFLDGDKVHKPIILVTIMIIIISNFRSLYHPLWGISLFFLMAAMYTSIFRVKFRKFLQKEWVVILFLLLGLLLWPIKNKILFGQFTFSSWQGFNLSRGTDVTSEVIEDYRREGFVPDRIHTALDQFQIRHGISAPNVLSQIEKSTGGRNWNHYLFLDQNPTLTRQAILYRLQNPLHWIKQTIFHYLTWTMPSFINPYTGELYGPDTPLYRQYARGIRNIFFYDLRPPLGTLIPPGFRWPHVIRLNRDVPFTIFGLLCFPTLLSLSILMTKEKWHSGKKAEAAFLALILFNVSWALAIPCLTDGYEGNRMRYAIFPLLLMILYSALGSLCLRQKLGDHKDTFYD